MKRSKRSIPAEALSVGEQIGDHMAEIVQLFKPGVKITVVVRTPDYPDGSRDMILTSDTFDRVIAALRLREVGPTLEGKV